MNRQDFQRLAEVRLREAEALLAAGLWDGAYYLAGYAVECGLKACIAKRTQAGDFPPRPEDVRDCYSHDFDRLLRVAELKADLQAERLSNTAFDLRWAVVKDWSEQSRYDMPSANSQRRAELLVAAVKDTQNGVLPWIMQRW